MNDLEDLLRDELRERAHAAEESATAGRPGTPLASLGGRIRRTRIRRGLAASALAAGAVAAAIALPVTLMPASQTRSSVSLRGTGSGHRVVPLSDPSLTPPGWSPVTYRYAQVSVPSSWVVQGPPGSVCGVTTHGAVLMGHAIAQPTQQPAGCRLPATTVFLSAIPFRPRPVTRQRLNGIPVFRLPGAHGVVSYAVPDLGVEVTARGPEASQVVATLTRSPLSVVLARGPAFPVPPAWRWHDFGGIRFATPGRWKLERVDRWGNCTGRPVVPGTSRLSTAIRLGCTGGTAQAAPLAGAWAPTAGVTVGAGRLASAEVRSGGYLRCLRLHGMRACMPVSFQPGVLGSPLELAVFPPGRPAPALIAIGLAGTGATTRTILGSIQPASGSH